MSRWSLRLWLFRWTLRRWAWSAGRIAEHLGWRRAASADGRQDDPVQRALRHG